MQVDGEQTVQRKQERGSRNATPPTKKVATPKALPLNYLFNIQ